MFSCEIFEVFEENLRTTASNYINNQCQLSSKDPKKKKKLHGGTIKNEHAVLCNISDIFEHFNELLDGTE